MITGNKGFCNSGKREGKIGRTVSVQVLMSPELVSLWRSLCLQVFYNSKIGEVTGVSFVLRARQPNIVGIG